VPRAAGGEPLKETFHEEREALMRKAAILAAGVAVAAGVAAAVALGDQTFGSAPTVVSVQARVIPNKAGTPRHPQGVVLKVHVHWTTPPEDERPIVQSAITLFPKGSLYNGGKYPRCSANTMNRRGLSACPRGSIMGHGTGLAYADTVTTKPQITIVNGGPRAICLYTVLNNPARVQACVPGTITKLSSGPWAYKLVLKVPPQLQVVAGVPIQIVDFTSSAGRGTWLATTGCKNGKWPFSVETFYDTGGSSGVQSSTPCRR
jgi:hypothetical protein